MRRLAPAAAVAAALCARRGECAAPTHTDGLTVATAKGAVTGKLERGKGGNEVRAFLGIPYAAPPVADLRWAAPAEHAAWSAPRRATSFGSCCVHGSSGGEDCLFLNVFAPAANTTAAREGGLPVMFYIHGGSFQSGCSSSIPGANLVALTGIVLVTVNYRLNVFGFLALKEMIDAGAVNWGLLDQQAGLRWTRDNIAQFGGNPNDVTVCGQSAGGASVSYHLVMPGSASLFHRGILESPGGRKSWVQDLREYDQDALTTAEIEANSAAFAGSHGCSGAGAAACLRGKTVSQLNAAPFGRYAPAVDGHEVEDVPLHMVRAGKWRTDYPVIIGSCSCESCSEVRSYIGRPSNLSDADYGAALEKAFKPNFPVTPEEVKGWYKGYAAKRGNWESFARIASDDGHACNAHFFAEAFAATSKASVYRYEFRHSNSYPGATHASDLSYFFSYGSSFSAKEEALSRAMARAWGAFVTTGDPGTPDHKWPPYDSESQASLAFDLTISRTNEGTNDDTMFNQMCPHWDKYM